MIPQFRNQQGLWDWIRWRRDNGFDTVMHVKGGERMGKSSFAIHAKNQLAPEMPIRDAYFYDWEDLPGQLRKAHQRFQEHPDQWTVFIGDEATNVFDKLDWNKKENKEAKKLFRQWAYLKAFTILIDPDGSLDKYILKHRAILQVIIDRRGSARLRAQVRDPNYERDPYFVDRARMHYPEAEREYPRDWNDYLPLKLHNMGVRINDAADNIERIVAERKKGNVNSQIESLKKPPMML